MGAYAPQVGCDKVGTEAFWPDLEEVVEKNTKGRVACDRGV